MNYKTRSPKLSNPSRKITIPTQDGFEVTAIKEILFCRADNNYTEVHFRNSKTRQ